MTDKDILERLKNTPRDYELRGNRMWLTMEREELLDVIQEFERLRKYEGIAEPELHEKIESLTKELEKLREENKLFDKDNIRNMNTSKGAIDRQKEKIDSLTRELGEVRGELKEFKLHRGKVIASNDKLTKINAVLKSKLEETVSLNDYEKLEAQLEVAEKERDLFKDLHYLCASDEIIKAYNRLEIFKSELEAENRELAQHKKYSHKRIAELKAKVEELNKRCKAWSSKKEGYI